MECEGKVNVAASETTLDKMVNRPKTWGSVAEMACGNWLSRKMTPPGYMELLLTADCNLRCSYCWERNKTSAHMSEEVAIAAVNFFLAHSTKGKELTILFFGGEPLLRFDLMKVVWDYATKLTKAQGRTVAWNMTTNGTLINEEIAVWCAKHKVKYLLSIDGGREVHDRYRKFPDGRGSYDLIVSRIPLMKRFQPWLGARMSVTPESCEFLCRDIEELHSLGVNQFLLGYAHGIPWTKQDVFAYENAMREACELYLKMKYHKRPFRMTMFEVGDVGKAKKHQGFGCGAGRGRICVDPHGDLYGCSKLATIAGMDEGILPLGNAYQGFTRIENRKALLNSSVIPRKKCQQCEFRDRCGGGCPAVSYFHTKNIYYPDDLNCKHMFINERIDAYMRRRHKEVFGVEVEEETKRRK